MAKLIGINMTVLRTIRIEFVIALEPQPWRKEALADEPDLVLDLALLPTDAGVQPFGSIRQLAAHLQEAAMVESIFADEDRLHSRLHIVVDAAPAGSLEQREGPVMGIEHHLLRLARIPSIAPGCSAANFLEDANIRLEPHPPIR
jgi:hypothetical protein